MRRFLRARQHDLKRAKEMYTASMKWRREFGVEEVTHNFHFTERDAFIALYPQGYHKTDKLVRQCRQAGVKRRCPATRGRAGGRRWLCMPGLLTWRVSPAPTLARVGGAKIYLLQCACACLLVGSVVVRGLASEGP